MSVNLPTLIETSMMHQSNAAIVTTHREYEFNLALFDTAFDANSNRNMNIAEAPAAAILQASPILKSYVDPSKVKRAVPDKAVSADTQVGTEMWRW